MMLERVIPIFVLFWSFLFIKSFHWHFLLFKDYKYNQICIKTFQLKKYFNLKKKQLKIN